MSKLNRQQKKKRLIAIVALIVIATMLVTSVISSLIMFYRLENVKVCVKIGSQTNNFRDLKD